MNRWKTTKPQGFSLIEVVIMVAVISVVFLGTFSLVGFLNQVNTIEHERTGASNVAAEHMERVKQTSFTHLEPYEESVTLWDKGTPGNTQDDTVGQVAVTFQNEQGDTLDAPPESGEVMIVKVRVQWQPRGRRSATTMHETVMTILTP